MAKGNESLSWQHKTEQSRIDKMLDIPKHNVNSKPFNMDEINRLFNIITTVRNIRAEKNVGNSKKINIILLICIILMIIIGVGYLFLDIVFSLLIFIVSASSPIVVSKSKLTLIVLPISVVLVLTTKSIELLSEYSLPDKL